MIWGPSPLSWYIGTDPDNDYKVSYGRTRFDIPCSRADRAQPATWPFLTHMHFNAVAGDSAPKFPWTFTLCNPRGLKCGDVLSGIYSHFHQPVTRDEKMSWPPLRQKAAQDALEIRCRLQESEDQMRRYDSLGGVMYFRGIEPTIDGEGWMICFGTHWLYFLRQISLIHRPLPIRTKKTSSFPSRSINIQIPHLIIKAACSLEPWPWALISHVASTWHCPHYWSYICLPELGMLSVAESSPPPTMVTIWLPWFRWFRLFWDRRKRRRRQAMSFFTNILDRTDLRPMARSQSQLNNIPVCFYLYAMEIDSFLPFSL